MARKKAAYMVFETKEEFDKMWDEQVKKAEIQGRADGFRDGCIWLMSYIEELFQDLFKAETFQHVQAEIRSRQIEEWRKNKIVETRKQHIDSGWKAALLWTGEEDKE